LEWHNGMGNCKNHAYHVVFIHYYKSWLFKKFKLTNLLFWLMDIYILIKGQGLQWHMYYLINQFNYNG
jgi:hypothetical protein